MSPGLNEFCLEKFGVTRLLGGREFDVGAIMLRAREARHEVRRGEEVVEALRLALVPRAERALHRRRAAPCERGRARRRPGRRRAACAARSPACRRPAGLAVAVFDFGIPKNKNQTSFFLFGS